MSTIRPGTWAELGPGIRRLTAPNPSMMTGPGTNTYVFGQSELAVVDPGPIIDSHLDLLCSAGDIRHILVTHTHPDHSPAAVRLQKRTGASLIGLPAGVRDRQDLTFVPDREAVDGESLTGDGFELLFVHTPGHASNHVCYLHRQTRMLVTGDHVIDGSTVVINPPDGNMRDYIMSLEKVRALKASALLPGHGGRIDDPERVIDWIIRHRLGREAKVVSGLEASGKVTLEELVPVVYKDVPETLHAWAARSLLAHLIKLIEDGRAAEEDGRYQLLD